jgi:hypothetical protein
LGATICQLASSLIEMCSPRHHELCTKIAHPYTQTHRHTHSKPWSEGGSQHGPIPCRMAPAPRSREFSRLDHVPSIKSSVKRLLVV